MQVNLVKELLVEPYQRTPQSAAEKADTTTFKLKDKIVSPITLCGWFGLRVHHRLKEPIFPDCGIANIQHGISNFQVFLQILLLMYYL